MTILLPIVALLESLIFVHCSWILATSTALFMEKIVVLRTVWQSAHIAVRTQPAVMRSPKQTHVNFTTDGRHVPIPCTTSHLKDTRAICQFTQVTYNSRKEQLCAHDPTLDVLPFAICCTATHFNDFLDSSSLEYALGEGTQRKDSACGGHKHSGNSEEDACGAYFCRTTSSWSHHKGTDYNASSHHNGELETDLSPGELVVPPNNTTLCSPSSLVRC